MAPRLNRRRFLLGTTAAGTATAAAVTAARLRSGPMHRSSLIPPVSTPTAVGTSTPTPPSSLLPSPSATPPAGGVAALVSLRSFTFDTFDAQSAGDASVLEVLGRTHSRILDWLDPEQAILGPALAVSWEQPSETTWALHLDPRATWQDRPPLNGRPVTAIDLVAHLDRFLQLSAGASLPLAQRAWDYATIDRVTAPDDATLIIETSRPDPFLLQTLAGPLALVQAPETVDAFAPTWHELAPRAVVGSGSFVFDAYGDAGQLEFLANPRAHAVPHLEALQVFPPQISPAAFLAGDLDEYAARDRRDAPLIRQQLGEDVSESSFYEDSPVVTTFHVGSAPWRDPNLRLAISAALNRVRLADSLFAGRARAAGPVSPATLGLALSESELTEFPGYRLDPEADTREAVSRWRSGAGDALGQVIIDFPAIFDPRYSASSTVTSLLNETLGSTSFHPAVDSYVNIAARAASGGYGQGRPAFWFGWGPPLVSPDPSRWLIETYHSAGATAAAAGFADDGIDNLLEKLSLEFDLEQRAGLTREVSRRLLETAAGGLLTWALQQSELFRAVSLSAPPKTPFWLQHRDRDITRAGGISRTVPRVR